jgi:hypothetical protein
MAYAAEMFQAIDDHITPILLTVILKTWKFELSPARQHHLRPKRNYPSDHPHRGWFRRLYFIACPVCIILDLEAVPEASRRDNLHIAVPLDAISKRCALYSRVRSQI